MAAGVFHFKKGHTMQRLITGFTCTTLLLLAMYGIAELGGLSILTGFALFGMLTLFGYLSYMTLSDMYTRDDIDALFSDEGPQAPPSEQEILAYWQDVYPDGLPSEGRPLRPLHPSDQWLQVYRSQHPPKRTRS